MYAVLSKLGICCDLRTFETIFRLKVRRTCRKHPPIKVVIVVIGEHFGHIDLNIMPFGKIYAVLSLGLLVAIYAHLGTFFACGFGLGNAPALFSALISDGLMLLYW